MCIFHSKCNKPCKTYKSHFRHWEHIRKFVQKKDSAFMNYRTYSRLSESAKKDLIQKSNIQKERTSKINHINFERYLVRHMVTNLIYDIVNKL
jgi:hypothetical protein